jgi:regulator of sigma E protease
MDIVISIVAFLFLSGLIITIHEGGHFLVGKLCGMKILEFSIGFGRKIYSKKVGKDNMLFTLRLLPLGGFVKPLDQGSVTEEEWNNLSIAEKKRSFAQSAKWKKFLMVAGGPLSNFILAFVIYTLALSVVGVKVSPPIISEVISSSQLATKGLKEGDKILLVNGKKVDYLSDAFPIFVNNLIKGDKVSFTTQNNTYVVDYSNVDLKDMATADIGKKIGFYFAGTSGNVIIKKIEEDSVAKSVGLQKNDEVLQVNKETMHDINKVIRRIQENPNNPIQLTIKRNGKVQEITITPREKIENGQKLGKIGVTFDIGKNTDAIIVKYGFLDGMSRSLEKVKDASYTTIISVKKMVMGQLSPKAISGPIALADYSGKSAQRGLYYYLMMIASISIAIGVSNLLPIPTLDGAHLIQYTIETIIRRDVPKKIMDCLQYIGVGVLVSIFSFSLINDLTKYLV